mmetsp:Transcript_12530/g.15739  ORF Transcript_12530/g.15739 Transcript_12530/m.15739 type:complete len:776 (+) Transcript_12530:132-2459(+)
MPLARCAMREKCNLAIVRMTIATLAVVCIISLKPACAFSPIVVHDSGYQQLRQLPALSFQKSAFQNRNDNKRYNRASSSKEFIALASLKRESAACDGNRGRRLIYSGLKRVAVRCLWFGNKGRRNRSKGINGIMGYYFRNDSYRPEVFRRHSSRGGNRLSRTRKEASSKSSQETIREESEITKVVSATTNFSSDLLSKVRSNVTNYGLNNSITPKNGAEVNEGIVITDEEEQAKDEELSEAAKIVKDAVQEVTQSVKDLGETVVVQAPSMLTILYRSMISRKMREDVQRVRKNYVSDFTDAFQNKRQIIPAVLFLYFACVAPAVSFGTIASEITNGYVGVVEFLLSSGLSGMAYALLSGQPMAFIAPTGLTLAFTSGLFSFCSLKNVPFFPIYSWVGLWTSLFMITLGLQGASKFIRYCTHFTDEVFNALLSVNFIFEALNSLQRNFRLANPDNLTMPFVSLAMALGTFWSTMGVIAIDASIYFNKKVRSVIKDFGPVAIIIAMSILNQHSWLNKFGVPTLGVSNTFQLARGRKFLIPIMSVPMATRLLCALPAFLLTALFFMDQNISTRLVNKSENGLKKGSAYNADMVALGLITAGLSVVGLPWMCGATVQSMNHVRAMTKTKFNEENETVEIESVTETRLSGFVIHAMIASTVFLLPLLQILPIPVVSGVFLFLGRKLMTGNSFLQRIRDAIAEEKRLPSGHPIHFVGRRKMNMFTGVQVACLLGLWKFKQYPATAIFFPSVIGVLMLIRSFVLPRFFTEDEFIALGDPTPT